jgi:hypothetical protein
MGSSPTDPVGLAQKITPVNIFAKCCYLKGQSINQGFCDNSTNALKLKSVAVAKYIKNCVTSFMDDPKASPDKLKIHPSSKTVWRGGDTLSKENWVVEVLNVNGFSNEKNDITFNGKVNFKFLELWYGKTCFTRFSFLSHFRYSRFTKLEQGSDMIIFESVSTGWRKSADFAVLDFNRLMENWISTDQKKFKCYKMEFNRLGPFWN